MHLQDFASVTDCTAASQLAYINSLAALLKMSPTSFTSSCSYGYINVNSRRRRGRLLQQVGMTGSYIVKLSFIHLNITLLTYPMCRTPMLVKMP